MDRVNLSLLIADTIPGSIAHIEKYLDKEFLREFHMCLIDKPTCSIHVLEKFVENEDWASINERQQETSRYTKRLRGSKKINLELRSKLREMLRY